MVGGHVVAAVSAGRGAGTRVVRRGLRSFDLRAPARLVCWFALVHILRSSLVHKVHIELNHEHGTTARNGSGGDRARCSGCWLGTVVAKMVDPGGGGCLPSTPPECFDHRVSLSQLPREKERLSIRHSHRPATRRASI